MKRLAVFAALLCIATHSAPAWSAKRAEFIRPTYAGAYEPQGVDERGLWMQIDEAERSFRDSPAVLHDASLESFVRKVLCNTVGQDRCETARIYIVQDSSFNAGMYPNGLMLVHTGLLARLHSEAELATVLGHEFAHFELRHTLNNFRRIRSGTDIMAWLALGSAATGVNTAQTQSSIIAGFYAFGREQEAEADTLAAKYVLASPYKLEGSAVWKRLTDEENALRQERGLKKLKKRYPDLTDTHPTNDQRFAFFLKSELESGGEGIEGTDEYRAATSEVLPIIFAGLVKGNDFAGTDYVIRSRGDALGWDAKLLFTRGELFRLRGNPRDLVTARDLFSQAITLPDAPAESWRGLGLCLYRLGDQNAGQEALRTYLGKLPNAADVATIKTLIDG